MKLADIRYGSECNSMDCKIEIKIQIEIDCWKTLEIRFGNKGDPSMRYVCYA